VNYSAGLQKELFGIKDISESWKGKIAEHVVGQELLSPSTKVSEKRFFWVREAKNSQAEIDFIFQYEDQLIPIEVKSGNCSTLKSLHSFMESSTHNLAIRFWNNPVSKDLITLPSGKKYSLYNLPFYYAGQLEVFMKQNHD
jgi:predicted AAA+ superfamily ATPase